jgi:hypothetical protein
MIATTIGKRFLNAYNETFNTHYSAKEFFVEIYFTLFFDHGKYMQWVTNSPFVQGIKKGVPPTNDERKLKLQILLDKIATNEADASIAIGFPSLELTASTSGQITNMNLPLKEEEDVYFSWIGGGLGIGVESGLSIFFDNKQILLDLFEGWKIYREYLNTTPELRGNQINTWNGQWLAHRYNKNKYDAQHPTASFAPFDTIKSGGMEVKTQSWTKVLVRIARNFPDRLEIAYVYSLGKTNITIGFIPFELPKIRLPYELYEKYFGTTDPDMVENLFGSAMGFTKICQMGAVGVNALEPKGFRDCLEKGKIPAYSDSDKEKKINFNTYQIWLLAMLNNEQLWEQAQQIALTLSHYSKSSKNAKKDKSQDVTNLLSSVNKKQFIEGLTVLAEQGQDVEQLYQIAEIIHLMPVDNVPYFLTLIRFQYSVISKKA